MPTRQPRPVESVVEVEQRDFSGGLHTLVPPSKLGSNETPSCYDVSFERATIQKRMGYERIINDALTDPGLRFNGVYGHVRIPAHATFLYGNDFDVVVKFRIDTLPAANTRVSLFCHGYAGGATESAGALATLLRSVWIFLDNTGTDTVAKGWITLSDATNTGFIAQHASALAVDTNYSVRFRRHTEGITNQIEIQVYNLDTGAQVGTQVTQPVGVATTNLDVSAFPIIVGAAPAMDTNNIAIPRQSIGVDNSGGLRHAVGPGADISSRGVVAEIFPGTIGELQIWLGTDGSREAADDTLRLDTQDSDVLAGKLAGYWRFNEGTGDEIGCSRDHTITGASAKDGEILGERAQYVPGLVGDATVNHAIKFNGRDHYLHCIDRLYSQDIVLAPQTLAFEGLLEKFFLCNDDDGFPANPWTIEFAFQFHKNPTEYNIAGGRKQCIASLWYYFTDNSAAPASWELPVFIFYIGTDNHLFVDVLTEVATGGGTLAVNYETLDGGVALTKDTTYQTALMKYDDFGRYLLYVDGVEKAAYNGTATPGQGHPDIDAVVNGAQPHQAHLFFAMNNDKYVEWNDQTPAAGIRGAGKGIGGYRTLAAMPSNCTIDEVRFWAWEDAAGNPVGARDGAGVVGAAVPAGENPPDENLILKYHDKELGALVLDGSTRTQEITERIGLWLYYDFREDWPDHLYFSDSHQWVIDNSRYRYLPAVLIPASNPPKWGRGVLSRSIIDSNYATNEIVHNLTGAIEMVQNYVKNDGTQQLLHVQSSTLRSFESGNSYTNEGDGFQVGNITKRAQGNDYLYMCHGPRRPTRWDGTDHQMAGVAAPTAQLYTGYVLTQIRAAPEAHLLSNKYYTYRYTFYNRDKNLESAPSPESPAIFTSPSNVSGLTGNDIEVNLSIPQCGQREVTHINIYRSEPLDQMPGDLGTGVGTGGEHSSARGSFWSLVAQIKANNPDGNLANTGGPSADTWWEGLPESMLGPQLETVGSGNTLFFRGYTPPTEPHYAVFWRERMFFARSDEHPARMWFSEPGEPESFVPDAFLDFDEGDGQPITGVVPLFNYLIVFKNNSLYVVSEDSGGVNQFVRAPFSAFKLHTNVGCSSHMTAQKLDENSVMFLGQKGCYLTDGRQVEYVSRKVENLFRDEISKSRQSIATATVFKGRNLYILCLTSAGETENDIALVYDYVNRSWTRWYLPFATITQTEDTTGTERIFGGGVQGRGYVVRLDSGHTDGAEFVRPNAPTEPDNLTGSPNALIASSTTTLVGPDGNNWNSVTGDKLRGMLIQLNRTSTGARSEHWILYTDTATSQGRVHFYPPAAFTPGGSDTYKIAGIRAQWDSPQFPFGKLLDRATLQDLDILQEPQSVGSATVYLKVDKGSYQQNVNAPSLTTYNSLVSFKGAFWKTGGGVGAGKLLQIRIEQLDPNVPMDIHDLVYRVQMMEGEQP